MPALRGCIMSELPTVSASHSRDAGRKFGPAQRLENLWRQGQRPDVLEFISKQENLTPPQIVAVLCVDQQQRWQRGERITAETYLSMHPALSAAWSDAFELIQGEFRLLQESGEKPTVRDFSRRFPHYAGKLQKLESALDEASAPHTANINTPGDVISTAGDVILDPRVAVEWPTIPGYKILGKLGQGGMGHVFKAHQDRLGRMVALKIIRKESMSQDPAAIRRFQREARAAAQLSHPNIIVIYDFNQDGNTYYLAMEYVEGIDMHNLVQDFGPLRPDVAAEFARQVASGLQHAHLQGMVHRDIKPSNLMVTLPPSEARRSSEKNQLLFRPDEDHLLKGVVKILDMGTALVTQAIDTASEQWTKQGSLMGTPDYLAPEQAIDSHSVDIRADLYSVGCTLYYLLTGKPPFGQYPLMRKLMMHQSEDAKPVRELQPEVPASLDAIVRRLMAKRKEDRFQTPADLADALVPVLSEPIAAGHSATPLGDRILDPRTPAPGWTPPPVKQKKKEPPSTPLPSASPPAPIRPAATDSGSTSLSTSLSGDESLPEDESDQRTPKTIAILTGHTSMVAALAFSPNRNTLASAAVHGNVRLWDFYGKKPSEKVSFQATLNDIHSLAYAPDKRTLATGSGSLDGTVWLWDLMHPMPRVKSTMEGHKAPVDALAYSSDAQFLATGSCDKTIRVWDMSSEEPTEHAVFIGHFDYIKALAFASDGKTLASGSLDGTIRLWRKAGFWSRSQLAVLEGSWGAVHCLAVSPDSTMLAFGALDETIRLWNLKGEQPQEVGGLRGHAGVVRRVLFPPHSKTMVSVCDGGRIVLWDLETMTKTREWQLPQENRSSVTLTHDGRYAATGLTDGTVHVFRLYPKQRPESKH
jgi:serine/threonine protein kinase